MTNIVLDNLDLPVVRTTENGYLKGASTVSRVGVFKYQTADGSIRKELRHPDDVFSPESLDTLKGVPIMFGHQGGTDMLDSKNTSHYIAGFTGDNVSVMDDRLLNVNLTITDADLIDKIKNKGFKELSMGYTRSLIPESGVFNGEEYTHRQKNIKYNHVAVVAAGRAGREARLITLDGVDHECDYVVNDKEGLIMETKNLDTVLDRLSKIENIMQVAKDSEHEAKLAEANGIIDGLKGELSSVKAELEKAVVAKDSADEDTVKNLVSERVDILVKANKLVALDSVDSMSNREVMEAAIKSKSPEIDLNGKHDAYIAGAFNQLAAFDSNATISQLKDVKVGGASHNNVDSNQYFAELRHSTFEKFNKRG